MFQFDIGVIEKVCDTLDRNFNLTRYSKSKNLQKFSRPL